MKRSLRFLKSSQALLCLFLSTLLFSTQATANTANTNTGNFANANTGNTGNAVTANSGTGNTAAPALTNDEEEEEIDTRSVAPILTNDEEEEEVGLLSRYVPAGTRIPKRFVA